MALFEKILIANRGEIACRVIHTARRLGIKTVSVYATADARAPHVLLTDEAVCIGEPEASKSYLCGDKIIKAAKQTGAQAIHPGYGFLSENADFARALAKAGLVFIGPPPKAIAAMGDKIVSKKLAAAAGVSTIPGYNGIIKNTAQAQEVAKDIGYPVMLKASAGGGGKGMRIAYSSQDIAEGFQAAQNEAQSSFGDKRVFVEKYVTSPRHIEIQILGDKKGRLVHFGERECSVQRRNQKVLEEAPSPFMTPQLRARMGAQAVALAKAVGYYSAGTVEFIVDHKRQFYFLEMNTRLQVEHPVTEMVYDVDLVEEMLRIAAGEPLRHTQGKIKPKGWAIEARLYAEDPYTNFLPSIGRLVRYRPPLKPETPGTKLRLDSGVEEGSEISLFYDPMIAKLITWGRTRPQALSELSMALDGFEIAGVRHNIDFLAAVCAHKTFQTGAATTAFIAEAYPDGFRGAPVSPTRQRALAALTFVLWARRQARYGRLVCDAPARAVSVGAQTYLAQWASLDKDKAATVMLQSDTRSQYRIGIETDWYPGDTSLRAKLGKQPMRLMVQPLAEGFRLGGAGAQLEVMVRSPQAQALMAFMPKPDPSASAKELRCPMPGVVVQVLISVGQSVKAGDPLFIVEAMKMENIVRAEIDGTIKSVHCAVEDKLAVDSLMLEFD